jgi:hypothetical protein
MKFLQKENRYFNNSKSIHSEKSRILVRAFLLRLNITSVETRNMELEIKLCLKVIYLKVYGFNWTWILRYFINVRNVLRLYIILVFYLKIS